MSLITTDLRAAGDRLIAAAAKPLQCDSVRDILGDNDIASAYEVQRLVTEHSLAQGRQIRRGLFQLFAPRRARRATP